MCSVRGHQVSRYSCVRPFCLILLKYWVRGHQASSYSFVICGNLFVMIITRTVLLCFCWVRGHQVSGHNIMCLGDCL